MSNYEPSVKIINYLNRNGWTLINKEDYLRLIRVVNSDEIVIYPHILSINATLTENDMDMVSKIKRELKEYLLRNGK